MQLGVEFYRGVLDTLSEQIAVIDDIGRIVYVNKSWMEMGAQSASVNIDWGAMNYLQVCEKSAQSGDAIGEQALFNLRLLMNGEIDHFEFEYPCHYGDEHKWFLMHACRSSAFGRLYFVISHKNITKRIVAENRAKKLASLDDLTQIGNRRSFEEFFGLELLRCSRMQTPLSIVLIDIDYFKDINDSFGHKAGDECLVAVGELLSAFCKRPSDFCARYGGDEFAVLWSSTQALDALTMAQKFLAELRALKIRSGNNDQHPYCTASIGIVSLTPDTASDRRRLIQYADKMLYLAKHNGRDRVEIMQIPVNQSAALEAD